MIIDRRVVRDDPVRDTPYTDPQPDGGDALPAEEMRTFDNIEDAVAWLTAEDDGASLSVTEALAEFRAPFAAMSDAQVQAVICSCVLPEPCADCRKGAA